MCDIHIALHWDRSAQSPSLKLQCLSTTLKCSNKKEVEPLFSPGAPEGIAFRKMGRLGIPSWSASPLLSAPASTSLEAFAAGTLRLQVDCTSKRHTKRGDVEPESKVGRLTGTAICSVL